MDWYGPTDEWPRHGEQHFRDALKHAREAGWWFVKYEGHSFGRAVCDKKLPKDARCEFLIFSTGGKDSEGPALTFKSLVDRCPHKGVTPRTSGVTRAMALLDEAEMLIEAAQACLEATGKLARVAELLDLAADQAAAAEEALNQAVELEEDAYEDQDRAAELAEAAGYPSKAPTEAEPLLDSAEERAVSAEELLKKPGASQARTKARQRTRRVHERIRSVRAQVDLDMLRLGR